MKALTDEKIISMYVAGFSIQQIWETYFIPVDIIRHVLATHEIHIRENDK